MNTKNRAQRTRQVIKNYKIAREKIDSFPRKKEGRERRDFLSVMKIRTKKNIHSPHDLLKGK